MPKGWLTLRVYEAGIQGWIQTRQTNRNLVGASSESGPGVKCPIRGDYANNTYKVRMNRVTNQNKEM